MNSTHILRAMGALLLCLAASAPADTNVYYNAWSSNYFSGSTQSGPTNDPDGDGIPNLLEFALGTDPLSANTNTPLTPRFNTNNWLGIEVLERDGHKPGVQLNIALSANLTNWFVPWWQRTSVLLQSSDPTNAVRERFTTCLPATNIWFARCLATLVESGAETATYYVATNGSDSNAGTSTNAPFATLAKAVGLASAGTLIYVRGGVYMTTSGIKLAKAGTPANPIRIRAYPGEQPVFNFTNASSSTDGINIVSNCWWLYDLEVEYAGHNGIRLSGSSNIVERCIVHHCGNTGIHMTSNSYAWPSYNIISNCDSYRNYDTNANGGNADGFSAKWQLGPGNVFTGCRAWENSDDGWDLWMGDTPVLITNCWAFRQGFNYFGDTNFSGNGQGFKLGGYYVPAAHKLIRCVSFCNAAYGVDQNNNTGGFTVDQNTVWSNVSGAYNLNHSTVTQGVMTVRNNLILSGGSTNIKVQSGALQTNNSWQLSSKPQTNDVLGFDVSVGVAARKDDGSLPETPFLKPNPGGRLIDQGISTGETCYGSLPDLGAYELWAW